MTKTFIAEAIIEIGTGAKNVWNALTDPEQIQKYLFGTKVVSDWKVGSPITYTGVWEGKEYADKGKIVELIPDRLLKTTYWSSFSGKSDSPENYSNVTYELAEKGNKTVLSVTQDNNPTKDSAAHSKKNWESVLKALKTLLEK
jgi:uncharacterized protein YndB with AHSA1/START domain